MDFLASRRDFLAGMCAASILGSPKVDCFVDEPAPALPPRRLLGTAVRPEQLASANPLREVIHADCDLLVPEYHGQWSAVEWRRGDPWFGNYDAIVDHAAVRGAMVRGHSLLWEQMTPDWARAALRHDADWRVIARHFAHLLPRYRGRIAEWVVVNEMIDTEDGHAGLRRTGFQRAFGNDYVRRALDTAHALDPDARLMINDYSLLHDNPVDERRRVALLTLVERLKRDGAPLHAVGLQGHLELAKGALVQPRVERFLAELAATGVRIDITELDVLEDDRRLPLARRDERVADLARSLLDVALEQPALASVTTWCLDDGNSWLQERAPATLAAQRCSPIDCHNVNRGLPYDGALRPKPLRDVVARVRV